MWLIAFPLDICVTYFKFGTCCIDESIATETLLSRPKLDSNLEYKQIQINTTSLCGLVFYHFCHSTEVLSKYKKNCTFVDIHRGSKTHLYFCSGKLANHRMHFEYEVRFINSNGKKKVIHIWVKLLHQKSIIRTRDLHFNTGYCYYYKNINISILHKLCGI